MDRLVAGQTLSQDQSIVSPNRQYTLIMQGDGNLVLYASGGKPTWHTNTAHGAGHYATLHLDGNFVLYARNGSPEWSTNTAGSGGDNFNGALIVSDDGKIYIVTVTKDVTQVAARGF